MGNPGKVAVLMGGRSAERTISLETGSAVLAALRARGIEAEALDLDRDLLPTLARGGYTRVFIAVHGRGGEDGQVQGALETLAIPYTGSGVLGSALAMDKGRAKQLWIGTGLPTPPFMTLEEGFDPQAVVARLGLPIMVKPAREGSSIGASKVMTLQALPAAYLDAARYDCRVLAERWITGEEYTVGILHGEALPAIRLETTREFYDYQAKYQDEGTRYHCPCGLAPEAEQDLRQLALRAFEALAARGWGRVDLIIDERGRTWLIEVNTVPGMTSHSLVPMAARAAGIGFEDLVLRILASAGLEYEADPACH